MSYTPPAGNAADVSWVGVAAYTPPAGNAASASWAGVAGSGAGALNFTGAGAAVHGVAGAGAGVLAFTGAGVGEFLGSLVEGFGAGTLNFTGAGVAAHGVAGNGAGVLAFAGAGVGVHPRHEVLGEVRLSGVLVNRRVRCYKRASGALMGQADTVAGRYRVHAGFDDGEVYVCAIDLASDATDWVPPAANRLTPVLASDTA